jgi:hypothetical protein
MSREGVIKIETNGKKKMGRPTTEPKNHVARLRMSDSELHKLEECCRLTEKSKTEILKEGLDKVYQEVMESKK